MLELKKKGETLEIVKYNYYPEGKECFGELTVDRKTHTVLDDFTKAENDSFGRYLAHAVKRIESYKDDKYPNEDIVVWY